MSDASNGGRSPSPEQIRTMLSDICTNSGADVAFDKSTFTINGSDDAVKTAMMVIHQIPFVNRTQYQIRVKLEVANEYKEFVSGKKNGKINKIMGQSKPDSTWLAVIANSVFKVMFRSYLTDGTNTISTLMFVEASTKLSKMGWTCWNKRCQLRSHSTFLTGITNASSELGASISSVL